MSSRKQMLESLAAEGNTEAAGDLFLEFPHRGDAHMYSAMRDRSRACRPPLKKDAQSESQNSEQQPEPTQHPKPSKRTGKTQLTSFGSAVVMLLLTSAAFAQLPYWEEQKALSIAKKYHLTESGTELLLSIRCSERGPDGLEFGVAQYFPNHPARQYAKFPEKSFEVQCEYAAGTIKKRYTGDLHAFALRYNASKQHHQWMKNVSFYMRKYHAKLHPHSK